MSKQEYQESGNVVVGFILHDLGLLPNVTEQQVKSIKSKLWGHLDNHFASDDYDFEDARDDVLDGLADDMEAMGFNDAQIRSVGGLLSNSLRKNFDDAVGNR